MNIEIVYNQMTYATIRRIEDKKNRQKDKNDGIFGYILMNS